MRSVFGEVKRFVGWVERGKRNPSYAQNLAVIPRLFEVTSNPEAAGPSGRHEQAIRPTI